MPTAPACGAHGQEGFIFADPSAFFFFFFTHPKVLAVIPNPSVDQPNRPAARSLGFTKFG